MKSGTVLAAKRKGDVIWQARVGHDRGRLEVLALVPPSSTLTEVPLLTEHELLELLGEHQDDADDVAVARQRRGSR